MGYLISSLAKLPVEDNVNLYVFVCGSSWKGGSMQMIEDNFGKLAEDIGPDAVIAKGFNPEEFTEELAEKYLGESWHELIHLQPALLITDSHPENIKGDTSSIIIPLKDIESKYEDFDRFFNALVRFVRNKDPELLERLEGSDFIKEANDIVELKPNFFGIGINLNSLIAKFNR